MLRNTFLHLPGIAAKKETTLWQQGIKDWDSFIDQERVPGIGQKRLILHKRLLRASKEALLAHDAEHFAKHLPPAEHHRCFDEFKEEAWYLDLEADSNGDITVITLTDGLETRTLVRGANLHEEELRRSLKDAKLLVTYNGGAYDLPLLRKRYGIDWQGLHVDLKTVAARKGHEGGLKELEKEFGITRDYEERLRVLIKSGDPSLLYRMWRGSGDDHYLELLLEYNEADAYHLYLLARKLL
ncbi:ribonuclease H-like domain-containing protein [Candidatus Woesearchaeota archaeon]|nr:ribonuclease H-like domain-containing protein [Candidatus Woesearchaeota archaeon]